MSLTSPWSEAITDIQKGLGTPGYTKFDRALKTQVRPVLPPLQQRDAPVHSGQIRMALISSGVVTHRSRKLNWPVSFISRIASRRPLIAAR